MKKLALITVSSLVISTAAFADDQGALCSMLASHQAMTAAYQQGVDVNGKAVTPADVNAQAMAGMPDILRVPVTVDMAKQLTTGWPAGTEMKSDMGVVELHKDGRITLGGQDVKNNTWTMCSKTAKEATPTPGAAKSAEKSSHKATHHASAKKQKKKDAEEWADKPAEAPADAAPVANEQVPAPAAMPSEEPNDESVKNEAPWSPGGAEPAPAPAAGGEPSPPPQPAAPPAISPPAAPAGGSAAPWDDEKKPSQQ